MGVGVFDLNMGDGLNMDGVGGNVNDSYICVCLVVYLCLIIYFA